MKLSYILIIGFCGTLCYIYVQFSSMFMQFQTLKMRSRKYEIDSMRVYQRADLNLKYDTKKQPEARRQIHDVNCKQIIEGDEAEIAKAKIRMTQSGYKMPSDLAITAATTNCDTFRVLYGYDDKPNSNEERDFPIAFNILLYKEVAQVELLLRTIYRPQNYYCLHVDGYSPNEVHQATRALVNCFDNVFIASRTESIVYEGFARLQADINCMSDHLDIGEDWKYLINLPSQEFPLKTNSEIVKILKIYNNSNDIEGILGNRMLKHRYIYKHKYANTTSGKYKLQLTKEKNSPPPHNITTVKGSAYGVFSRKFVEYVINNKVAIDILNWCRSIRSPDEYYWATLNHNPHLKVPGGFTGKADEKPWLAVYAAWSGVSKCHGRWLRGVCVFGIGDLNNLVDRKEIFANKFLMNFEPLTLQCLSEWFYNKTISPLPFDGYYYKQLPFIRLHT